MTSHLKLSALKGFINPFKLVYQFQKRSLSSIKPLDERLGSKEESRSRSMVDKLPKSWQPYAQLARVDKPVGTNLLFIPCSWSILMSAYHAPDLPLSSTAYMLSLFYVGAFVMRGAGCTINDLWDCKLDRKVERTKIRPIAAGIISPRQALGFLALQLSAGLAVLTQLNWYSIFLGASSMGLVSMYPLAKRFTHYPQAVLGLTFNWGALLGWSAMLGSSAFEVTVPLYTAGVCWTLIYDTIYAHQDKKDDKAIGVKSTALTFGDRTKQVCYTLTAAMATSLLIAGATNDQTLVYHTSVLLATANTANIIRKVNLNSPQSCNKAFIHSQNSGWLLTLGIALDVLLMEK